MEKLRFQNPVITQQEVAAALDAACRQIQHNLPAFTHTCQNHSSVNNIYPACENNQWTCGFWPGEVWLAYEHTGEESFKQCALTLVESFLNRIEQKIEVDHHDMGFLYSPSCVAAYKLTGSENGKKAAILAADQLISRFQEKGAFIQAWGALGAPENYRYIIDCLLNLPLLYWATEVTKDKKYAQIAHKHITTCLKNSIRADGSTYHTFFMDSQTGMPSHGATCQGYKDDSFWARGQAWGVYGTAISYCYTKNPAYLDAFRRTVAFYLTRLPQDLVPYWDMIFTTGSDEPRDSSSASIVACGMLEAAKYMEEDEAEYYTTLARQMMKSVVDNYAAKDIKLGGGLVLHGTYSKKSPYNTCTPEGVDECVSWGDYFYMEALTRLSKNWEMYW
ncbi:MAG: glycoside hydrolase family 88 protein [Oscillospiraceae bacterium]|nr:glycoside hydrolase family 88 protein [Oscillospiraceae bacterium]